MLNTDCLETWHDLSPWPSASNTAQKFPRELGGWVKNHCIGLGPAPLAARVTPSYPLAFVNNVSEASPLWQEEGPLPNLHSGRTSPSGLSCLSFLEQVWFLTLLCLKESQYYIMSLSLKTVFSSALSWQKASIEVFVEDQAVNLLLPFLRARRVEASWEEVGRNMFKMFKLVIDSLKQTCLNVGYSSFTGDNPKKMERKTPCGRSSGASCTLPSRRRSTTKPKEPSWTMGTSKVHQSVRVL